MIATPGPRSHDVGRRCVRFYTIAVSFSFLDLAFVWEVGQVALGNPQTAMTSKDCWRRISSGSRGEPSAAATRELGEIDRANIMS